MKKYEFVTCIYFDFILTGIYPGAIQLHRMNLRNFFNLDGILIFIGSYFVFCGIAFLSLPPHQGDPFSFNPGIPLLQNSFLQNLPDSPENIKSGYFNFIFMPWLFLFSGLTATAYGIYLRNNEKKLLAVANSLHNSREILVDDLAFSLDLDSEYIIDSLKTINKMEHSDFLYDANSRIIVDAKLKQTLSVNEACPGCSKQNHITIALDLTEELPQCSHCGKPYTIETLNQIKHKHLLKGQHDLNNFMKISENNITLLRLLDEMNWLVIFIISGAIFLYSSSTVYILYLSFEVLIQSFFI